MHVISKTTMIIRNAPPMAVCLTVILLAATTAASVLSIVPGETSEVSSAEQRQKGGSKPLGTTSKNIELYNNMVLAEQELGETDDDDYNDNDDSNKSNKDNSLLSMMANRGHYGVKEFNDHLMKCASCAGVLPVWYDENVNEQSYCFPDGPTTQKKDNYNEGEEENSICSGASRCWKAKVRELDGRVRISRGCVSGGSGSNRYSNQNDGTQHLHPCLGTVPVETASKESNNSKHPPYLVWTSSHIYSSSTADKGNKSPIPPPRYVIECCAGRDMCNDGQFPSLPIISSPIEHDGSQLPWWYLSPITMIVLLLVVIIVVSFTVVVVILFRYDSKRQKRKWQKRNKSNSSRQRNKIRKRSHHYEDGQSDDSDKKKRRHFSFSSMSSSSTSSLSSISSTISCCEGKTGKKSSRKNRHATALTMVDLLKGVVVTNDSTIDDDMYVNDSHQQSYAEYSPAALTELTIDDDILPPPYKRQNDDHQKSFLENDCTSGSGYGMPVLVQRTLAKQIQFRQLVGKGRYGQVWRATYWNGGHEHVAVKIFLSKDEPSWKRETEIYSTVLMRHDNILGFIGSDIMTSRNSYTTQLLLITHYHRHGSLYDFLQTADDAACSGYNTGSSDMTGGPPQRNEPLTMIQMLNVLYTIVSGLCHLHTEIHGTQGKPGIAHRDVKSKNVLVKCARTGTCCVADFGMAVTSRDATLPIQTTIAAGNNNQNTRVGTKRYMAPEVLDDSISSAAALAMASASIPASESTTENSSSAYWCFDAYRRGDVYSYALVMWEVMSRTLISPRTEDNNVSRCGLDNEIQQQPPDINQYNPYVYRPPYHDRGVGWDPSFDEMRQIVCSADPILSRPGVAKEWQADPIMNAVVVTMRECWHANPNARLPTLRVKKTLAKLIDQLTTSKTEERHKSEQLTTTEQL